MAMDKNKLKTDLEAMFQSAYDNNYTKSQIAEALAGLIDGYVKSADVTGVVVEVKNPGNAVIGTGTQTNSVKLT